MHAAPRTQERAVDGVVQNFGKHCTYPTDGINNKELSHQFDVCMHVNVDNSSALEEKWQHSRAQHCFNLAEFFHGTSICLLNFYVCWYITPLYLRSLAWGILCE